MQKVKQTLSKVAVKLRPWRGLIAKVAFLIVAVFILFGVVFGLKRMPSIAMSPVINDGDLTMFTRIGNSYAENDVVLYENNGKTAISRIIAKGGQTVNINGEGYMTVDNVVVSRMPVTNDPEKDAPLMGMPFTVPLQQVYLLNDNYELKDDSRVFGGVFENKLQGKVITVLKVRGI